MKAFQAVIPRKKTLKTRLFNTPLGCLPCDLSAVVGPAVEGLPVVALLLGVPAGPLQRQGHQRLRRRARAGACDAAVASWGRLGAVVCVFSRAGVFEVALVLRGGRVVATHLPSPGALQP